MFSRREALTRIAAAAMAGPVGLEAQHVHARAADEAKSTGGIYQPKVLTQDEFNALVKLCDMIVPGASRGGAAEFIDVLCSQNREMQAIYTGGLAWLDFAMKRDYARSFLLAAADQQRAMLDRIAYRRNETLELAAGIRFFDWARKMTVDAYYTSAAGIKELGYMGNWATKEFKTPAEAVEYALKRSPLA